MTSQPPYRGKPNRRLPHPSALQARKPRGQRHFAAARAALAQDNHSPLGGAPPGR